MQITAMTFRYIEIALFSITIFLLHKTTKKREDLKSWRNGAFLLFASVLIDQAFREAFNQNLEQYSYVYFTSVFLAILAISTFFFGVRKQKKKLLIEDINVKRDKKIRLIAFVITFSLSAFTFALANPYIEGSDWIVLFLYCVIGFFLILMIGDNYHVYLMNNKKPTNLFLLFTSIGFLLTLFARIIELFGISDISYLLMISDMTYILMLFSISVMTIYEER